MLWPFELSEPDICRPLFVNTDSGGIDIFEKYASSSTYVDALKFRLLQYDEFYSEWRTTGGCFGMSYDAYRTTNKGPVPYCGSNENNSTGVSLSEILFSFMLEKYIVCDACGLRCPSFEISSVLYITPICTPSMQELIKQGMKLYEKSSAFDTRKTLGMSHLIIFYNLLNIWLLLLIN